MDDTPTVMPAGGFQSVAPNPFNPQTTISFMLPEAAPTNLRIYNVSGHLVRTLMNGSTQPGERLVNWAAYIPVPESDLPSFMVDRSGR